MIFKITYRYIAKNQRIATNIVSEEGKDVKEASDKALKLITESFKHREPRITSVVQW